MTALFKKKEEEKNVAQPVEEKGLGTHTDIPQSSGIVKNPHITERALRIGQYNQYVFLVDQKASKPEIKKELEKIYGVQIKNVRTTAQPTKTIFWRGKKGSRPRFKKAIITLEKGQSIDVMQQ